MALGRGKRLKGLPPSSPDMTTPLGLSRQHLSYLQEIGSGWFGKVRGLGVGGGGLCNPGLRSCSLSISPAPTTSHQPHLPTTPLSPPIALTSVTSHPLPPTPTPHVSVSTSLLIPLTTPPRHLALHASICPSFHLSLHPPDSGPVSLSPRACSGGDQGWRAVKGEAGKKGQLELWVGWRCIFMVSS